MVIGQKGMWHYPMIKGHGSISVAEIGIDVRRKVLSNVKGPCG
jgi:hypothetical protein